MKPAEVAQAHRDICASAKCEYLDRIDYSDICSFCPNGHFGKYELVECQEATQEIRGVGDLIATVAQPIASTIDKLLGTNLKTCGGCAQRRDTLNKKFPL